MKLLLLMPLLTVAIYLVIDHYTFWKQMGYYGKRKKS